MGIETLFTDARLRDISPDYENTVFSIDFEPRIEAWLKEEKSKRQLPGFIRRIVAVSQARKHVNEEPAIEGIYPDLTQIIRYLDEKVVLYDVYLPSVQEAALITTLIPHFTAEMPTRTSVIYFKQGERYYAAIDDIADKKENITHALALLGYYCQKNALHWLVDISEDVSDEPIPSLSNCGVIETIQTLISGKYKGKTSLRAAQVIVERAINRAHASGRVFEIGEKDHVVLDTIGGNSSEYAFNPDARAFLPDHVGAHAQYLSGQGAKNGAQMMRIDLMPLEWLKRNISDEKTAMIQAAHMTHSGISAIDGCDTRYGRVHFVEHPPKPHLQTKIHETMPVKM